MIISNGFTTKWKEQLINLINIDKNLFNDLNIQSPARGIHLAVFTEPFLSLLLSGKKRVESQFTINKGGPYQKVSKGDIVLIKKSGGPVCGFFVAGDVHFFINSGDTLKEIKRRFSEKICSSYVKRFW